jgi:hypothetical protein
MSESIHLESQLTMSPAVWQCSQTGSESITVIESSEKLRWGEIGGIAGGVVVLAVVIWLQFRRCRPAPSQAIDNGAG